MTDGRTDFTVHSLLARHIHFLYFTIQKTIGYMSVFGRTKMI
jgi:hypothetical protein